MLLEKKSVVLWIGLLLFLIACDENGCQGIDFFLDFNDRRHSLLLGRHTFKQSR